MTLGDLIKTYRKERGLTMQEFAKISGLSKGYISMLEKGKHPQNGKEIIPSIDTFNKVAKAMGVTLNKLLESVNGRQLVNISNNENAEEKPNVEPISIGKTVRIPVYGRIPAGIPIEAIEDIEDYIDVSTDLAKNNDLIALKVVGDSMYPKYLDGDYVLIRKQSDCENGQDCAIRINGNDVTLKKVIKEQDGLMLQPINPEYVPKKYDYHDEFNPVYIIGVVIELRRKI